MPRLLAIAAPTLLGACQLAASQAAPKEPLELAASDAPDRSPSRWRTVCESSRELEDGRSFALRVEGAGARRSVVLVVTLPTPPYADEQRLEATAEPPLEPLRLALERGGEVRLERAPGRLTARLDWQGRREVDARFARLPEVELVCDDGSGPEQGELNAMTLEQMGPDSLRRPFGLAREGARDFLKAEPELLAIDVALQPAAAACEGFAELRFSFRAATLGASVQISPTAAGEDCIYKRQVAELAGLPAVRSLAAAGGLEAIELDYAAAAGKARSLFPQLALRPAFTLLVPERLAPEVGSSYYRFFGVACGREAEVLVDAASGEARAGDPAPGECP